MFRVSYGFKCMNLDLGSLWRPFWVKILDCLSLVISFWLSLVRWLHCAWIYLDHTCLSSWFYCFLLVAELFLNHGFITMGHLGDEFLLHGLCYRNSCTMFCSRTPIPCRRTIDSVGSEWLIFDPLVTDILLDASKPST